MNLSNACSSAWAIRILETGPWVRGAAERNPFRVLDKVIFHHISITDALKGLVMECRPWEKSRNYIENAGVLCCGSAVMHHCPIPDARVARLGSQSIYFSYLRLSHTHGRSELRPVRLYRVQRQSYRLGHNETHAYIPVGLACMSCHCGRRSECLERERTRRPGIRHPNCITGRPGFHTDNLLPTMISVLKRQN